MENPMQLIYTGLEQIVHSTSDEHMPITKPTKTSIQVVYSGFEQMDSFIFGLNHQRKGASIQKIGMLMFEH